MGGWGYPSSCTCLEGEGDAGPTRSMTDVGRWPAGDRFGSPGLCLGSPSTH